MGKTRNTEHEPATQDPIVRGLCQCGCGKRTKLARSTDRSRGRIEGEPLRYVRGHHARKENRYIETPTGHATPCWIWQLVKNNHGYGLVKSGPGNMKCAHRVSYESVHGPVAADLKLDHLCRVTSCVNPDHLEPVSHAENCRRGRNTKLTAREVSEIRASSDSYRVIARRFGVSPSHISSIRTGRSWRDPSEPTPAHQSGGLRQ
jgi:HNH endonuclease